MTRRKAGWGAKGGKAGGGFESLLDHQTERGGRDSHIRVVSNPLRFQTTFPSRPNPAGSPGSVWVRVWCVPCALLIDDPHTHTTGPVIFLAAKFVNAGWYDISLEIVDDFYASFAQYLFVRIEGIKCEFSGEEKSGLEKHISTS